MATSGPTAKATITHSSATRTRIKVKPEDRGKGALDRMKAVAEQQPGVTGVEVNHQTGSILIHHERGASPASGFVDAAHDLGVIITGLEAGDIGGPGAHSDSAEALESALGDLNRRVAVWTGGRVDLKFLVPVAFVGAGVWRAIESPAALLGDIPPFLMIWFGFDLYSKFRFAGARPSRKVEPEHSAAKRHNQAQASPAAAS